MLSLILLALAAQPQADRPAPITASKVVTAIQPRLPQRFSPEVALVGASAQGDTIVLRFEVTEAALAGATPDLVSQRFSFGFCNAPHGAALLEGPLSLRIDARTPAGREVRGAVLESCPVATTPLPVPR